MSSTTEKPQVGPGSPILPTIADFESNAWQGYIRSLRHFWRDKAYASVVAIAPPQATPVELEKQLRDSPEYGLYAWLERRSQQFKYYGRWGLVPTIKGKQKELEDQLDAAQRIHPERLVLPPDFVVPEYVTRVDTHQHRGGLWRERTDGYIYEAAASGPSFSMLSHDTPVAKICEAAKRLLRTSSPDHLIDLGCTAGPVARALKRLYPKSRVTGCDVSAPALRLAHMRALQQDLEVDWLQAGAEKLPYRDASVDFICSNYLIHEMPPESVRASFREARRLLKPGGVYVAQDMYLAAGGNIGAWLQAGYAARNNEPFAYGLINLDLEKELSEAGFTEIDIRLSYPDREPGNGLPPARTHYVTLISARAPAGAS